MTLRAPLPQKGGSHGQGNAPHGSAPAEGHDAKANQRAIKGLLKDAYDNAKNLLDGDPMGGVGLISDAAQLAQLLIPGAAATPIIAGGLTTLSITSKTLGFGNPDTSAGFDQGANRFQSVGGVLQDARPTDSWQGSASDAYAEQNSLQMRRTGMMLDADNRVMQILSRQAQDVDHARRGIDNAAKGLGAAIFPALAMEATAVGCPESIAFQWAAVGIAAGYAAVTMGQLLSSVEDNAAQLNQVADQYRQAAALGQSADPSGNTPADPGTSRNAPTASTTRPDVNYRTSPDDGTGGEFDSGGQSDSGGGFSASGRSGASGGSDSVAKSGSGTGTGSGAGQGASSTSGSAQPAALATSANPATASTPAGGMSMPATPQTAGGSGGLLSGLAALAGAAIQAANQAAAHGQPQDPNAAEDKTKGDPAQDPDGPKDGENPEDPNAPKEDGAQPDDQPQAGAGPAANAGRPPIQVIFDDGAHHAEVAIDPDKVKGPVHVSLDPANPTAPPRITTEL